MDFRYKPYEGKEPYVFISYCRADTELCKELVSRLGEKGIRIWYDNAIHVGDVWPEMIATRLKASHVCILLITDGFVSSVNCNKELTYAAKYNIPVVPLRVKGVNITPGMELMIGSVQYIIINRTPDGKYDLSVFDRVLDSQFIKDCISDERQEDERLEREQLERERLEREQREKERREKEQLKPAIIINERGSKAFLSTRGELSVTEKSGRLDLTAGIAESQALGFAYERGKARLENNLETIIYSDAGVLRKGESTELLNDIIRLQIGQRIVTIISGETAAKLKRAENVATLYCEATDETYFITEGELKLGSDYPWAKGTMDDKYISGINSAITENNGKFEIKDADSVNGTIYNGRLLERGESIALKDGDSIQIGGVFLKFRTIHIQELETK